MDTEFGKKVFENLVKLYIIPEIEKRKNDGLIQNDFILDRALIIFFPDIQKPKLLINEELKGTTVEVTYKKGIVKHQGEIVLENEIEGINKIDLNENEYPNCAYAALIKLNNIWNIVFNFTYNKQISEDHINVAKQFWALAKVAYKNDMWNAYVENLFNTIELTAKAFLLLFPDNSFKIKDTKKHDTIRGNYNRFISLGNLSIEYKETFDKLNNLRYPARYLRKGDLNIEIEDAREYLRIVDNMIKDVEKRLNL
jgi:HEPN domain-containing protein